jgi:hypothetical protein
VTRHRNAEAPYDLQGHFVDVNEGGSACDARWKPIEGRPDGCDCQHGPGHARIFVEKAGPCPEVLCLVPPAQPLEARKNHYTNSTATSCRRAEDDMSSAGSLETKSRGDKHRKKPRGKGRPTHGNRASRKPTPKSRPLPSTPPNQPTLQSPILQPPVPATPPGPWETLPRWVLAVGFLAITLAILADKLILLFRH